jgi:hypothetical protein
MILKYIQKIVILTAILQFIGWFASKLFQNFNYNHYTVLLIIFILISTLVHFVIVKAKNSTPASFVRVFYVTSVVKILLYLITLLVFIFTQNISLKPFLISFLFIYLVYTIFEVFQLFNDLKSTK